MAYPYKRTPRPHQRKALIQAYAKKQAGLFLRIGSGKTKIALDFIGVLLHNNIVSRCLVIAPLNALGVWEDEIILNMPDSLNLKWALLRPKNGVDLRTVQLLIVNYEYARRILGVLMSWAPEVIICDESHRIKGPYTRQSKCTHKLGAISKFNLALTGTPASEKPLGLWSQFQFIDPSILNCTYKEFKYEYGVWTGFGNFKLKCYKNLDKLAKILAPHIITMKESEYLKLPEETSLTIPVEMSPKAQTMYRMMEREFLVSIKGKEILAPLVITQLTKLSQIAGGFIIDQEHNPLYISDHKIRVLGDLCHDLLEDGIVRLIVFCRFIWEIDQAKMILSKEWEIGEISGRIEHDDRVKLQHRFNSDIDRPIVAVCQIASGSASINMQAAHHEVFYSWDYSAINYDQAKGRIRRDGQTKDCYFHHLVSRNTIDGKILRILKQKKDVADYLEGLIKEISNDSSRRR
jgi:SNF2 family DNA or RNA helicase